MNNKKWVIFDFCETLVDFQSADVFIERVAQRHPRVWVKIYLNFIKLLQKLRLFTLLNVVLPNNSIEKNFWVYGFDAGGEKDFTDIKWEGKNVLLFGSEGFGMREHTGKYADFFVKIDINKDIESLNISNSAAIVFHHLSYVKKKS